MHIPVILGTARKGRQSLKVAKFIMGEAKKAGLKSEIIDVRDYRIPATDNTEKSDKAKKLARKIQPAEGLIIVTPEYNFSYPGELKMMLDLLYKQYEGKPVGICSVSGGAFGGARAAQELKLLCVTFCMHPICQTLYFPDVQEQFDGKGKVKDEKYYKRAKRFLDCLSGHAKALKKI
ncbi:MAG: NADPH-dependent FMN reductase [Candidatus Micrarchaeota archaeon]